MLTFPDRTNNGFSLFETLVTLSLLGTTSLGLTLCISRMNRTLSTIYPQQVQRCTKPSCTPSSGKVLCACGGITWVSLP